MSVFSEWLTQELNRRGWSHRGLARQSGISQTQISAVIAGERKANADFCIKVALAFDTPLDTVLQLAGILPGEQSLNPAELGPVTREILELIHNMPPEAKQEVLNFVRYLRQKGKG